MFQRRAISDSDMLARLDALPALRQFPARDFTSRNNVSWYEINFLH